MPRKFWNIRNAADEPGVGELLLYGPIGSDDGLSWLFDNITPKQFREDLDALGAISELRVFINSPGGDVFAGQAIHTMLRRHPANVTAYVDGLAASIASVVAMAGDRIIMPRNAMMMVHNPMTIALGDAEEFRQVADTLDQIRESIVAAYQGKTGMEHDELVALLDAETWMTAEEAVEQGFADEIEEAKQVAASMIGDRLVVNGQEMDLGRFRNRPRMPEETRLPFDQHRAQVIALARQLATRWQAMELTASRRERLRADVTALEDVLSDLRVLLPDAAGDDLQAAVVEEEIFKARLNGVAI